MTPEEVARIAARTDPVIRNLQITECYSRLAAAVADGRPGANWCTFATWASRQAGSTIRGEDLLDHLQRDLARRRDLLHPIQSFWRWLLRRGGLPPPPRLRGGSAPRYPPLRAVGAWGGAGAR